MPGKKNRKPNLQRNPEQRRQQAHKTKPAAANKNGEDGEGKTGTKPESGKYERAKSERKTAKNADRIVEPVESHESGDDTHQPAVEKAAPGSFLIKSPQQGHETHPCQGKKPRYDKWGCGQKPRADHGDDDWPVHLG